MKINAAIKYQKERSAKLKAMAADYKAKNPFASAKETAEALGISCSAVASYFREFKKNQDSWKSIGDCANSIIEGIKVKKK